jgi:uncharacterized protein (TIGR02598 family)
MKFGLRRLHAFSLVEVTLALGIAAFCLIAVFGLVPVGVQTNRNATSQTAATNILSSVVSDIRASPQNSSNTPRYGIRKSKTDKTTVCFDGQGQFTTIRGDVQCPATFVPPGGVTTTSRYRLYVLIANNGASNAANYAWLKVSWPAVVNPTTITPSGSVETVASVFVK